MKAIGYCEPGGSDVLREFDVAEPLPGPRDLLVDIRAVAVNAVDVKLRSKARPKGQPRILGFDGAGIVTAVGSEVTLFAPGDRVFHAGTIGRPGTNARLHLVDERIAGKMPASLSFEEAAALPLTAITAWELLFDQMGATRGAPARAGSILIINGAGGVGSMLVQLAARLTHLHVIATASRPETAAWVRSLGANTVIDHKDDLGAQLDRAGISQVSHIAALTGTDRHWPTIARIIAPRGRIGIIDDPVSLDIVPLRAKAASVTWEAMFVRSQFATSDMIEQHRLLCAVADLVDAGRIRTTMHDHFGPLTPANLARAHDHVASGRAVGKAVLGPMPG
ncbi:zinc-binding alcohol dehydrogenase family protein [Sphingobium sp. R-21]|uniref:zinc-binding alcohol dehydrogenase family protein n=1 Tax=Sphingobium sp. R-21 TaxID=3404056 RepID=UPI003CF1359A